MISLLNWQEIALLVNKIRPEIQDLFVDRIIIPERERFSEGYLKGEWLIRLTGKKHDSLILFSIHPRRPYFAWCAGKGPKASTRATHSPFELNVSKTIKGARLLQIESLPRERVIILWFSQPGESRERTGLILSLIPASPEALLVSASEETKNSKAGWPILARSRTIRDESKQSTLYFPPDGAKAPPHPEVRSHLFTQSDTYFKQLESELQFEAFSSRWNQTQKSVKEILKLTQERLKQNQATLKKAKAEEDWQYLGDLLKSTLGLSNSTEPQSTRNPPIRIAHDYINGIDREIKCDPQLTLQEQVEKFYQNSKRKQRRISEAESRIQDFEETLENLSHSHLELPIQDPKLLNEKSWSQLEKLEHSVGITHTSNLSANLSASGLSVAGKKNKKIVSWPGKSFISKDKLVIWVGRSKDENLELTFKYARGNDLWLHVRGKPGAHAVIPIQPGKSAPLDTLLDAAHLVIYYSNGENWGKTEVDYTFKKYVKRIKDSKEVSYTNNKTLIVLPDPARVKKLGVVKTK